MASCPRCRVPLVAAVEGAGYVDVCEACAGRFLSREGAERLLGDVALREQLLADLPVEPYALDLVVTYLPCPVCDTRMNRRQYGRHSRVVVELCREHGVWFEKGGLRTALAYVKEGGLVRAEKEEEAEARAREVAARADAIREKVGRAFSAGGAMGRAGPFQRWRAEVELTEALEVLFEVLR